MSLAPADDAARARARIALVLVAGIMAATGLVAAWNLMPVSFGSDASIYRQGAEALLTGGDPVLLFVYTPVAAVAAIPLTWVSVPVAGAIMTAIGATILAVGLLLETRGLRRLERALIAVAVVTSIPVINELSLGQVTLLMAASLWPVVRNEDRARHGVWLGLVFAAAPKPMLLPVLAWMLLRRPRALAGAIGVAAAVVAASVVVLGLDPWRDWIGILAHHSGVVIPGSGSIWSIGPGVLSAVLAAVVFVAAAIVIIRSDDECGFAAAILAGLLLAPFSLAYAVTIALLIVATLLRWSFWPTVVLLAATNFAIAFAFLPWLLALFAVAVAAALWRPEWRQSRYLLPWTPSR